MIDAQDVELELRWLDTRKISTALASLSRLQPDSRGYLGSKLKELAIHASWYGGVWGDDEYGWGLKHHMDSLAFLDGLQVLELDAGFLLRWKDGEGVPVQNVVPPSLGTLKLILVPGLFSPGVIRGLHQWNVRGLGHYFERNYDSIHKCLLKKVVMISSYRWTTVEDVHAHVALHKYLEKLGIELEMELIHHLPPPVVSALLSPIEN